MVDILLFDEAALSASIMAAWGLYHLYYAYR